MKYRCPDCDAVGEHAHPTDGVKSCDGCAYCAGIAAFTAVRD